MKRPKLPTEIVLNGIPRKLFKKKKHKIQMTKDETMTANVTFFDANGEIVYPEMYYELTAEEAQGLGYAKIVDPPSVIEPRELLVTFKKKGKTKWKTKWKIK